MTRQLQLFSRFAIFLILLLSACQSRSDNQSANPNQESKMNAQIPEEDIRQPAVAGSWYSDNPAELRAQLEGYMVDLEDYKLPDIRGIVCPHAGYIYSGPVAAYAYRQLQNRKYDDVIVVAPSHVEAFLFASVYGRGAYETPLGLIPVDVELAKAIASGGDLVKISDRGHRQEHLGRQEHALEIQLPFLQMVLGNFKLVPIIMGDQSPQVVHELADAIVRAVKGKNVLLVASSDLSHFHTYEEANTIDQGLVDRVANYDYSGLLNDLMNHKVEACGGGPICTVMEACQKLGAGKVKVLQHANSGDTPYGDNYQVVGYLAAAFYSNSASSKGTTEKQATEETEPKLTRGDAEPLSLEDKRTLMQIAQETVKQVVQGNSPPEFEINSEDLMEDRGAFVTLHEHGQLRGCIGYIVGIKPLWETVRDVAESAALRDPRFPPVQPDELDQLEYEISALSPVRQITDVSEIKVGVHGIIIRKGYHQGLLLPQVATEQGWDRNTFLQHTCLKAGLPTSAWKDPDAEIQIFSAEVFDEKDIE